MSPCSIVQLCYNLSVRHGTNCMLPIVKVSYKMVLSEGLNFPESVLTRVPHNFATLTVWGLLMAQFKGLCATKKLIRPLLQVVCPSVAPESSGAQPGDYRKGLTCIIMHNINRTFQSFVCSNACDKSWDIKPNNHFVWGWRHTCCTSTKQCCTSLPCRNSACKGGGPRGFVCHLLPDVQDSAGPCEGDFGRSMCLAKETCGPCESRFSNQLPNKQAKSKHNESTMKASFWNTTDSSWDRSASHASPLLTFPQVMLPSPGAPHTTSQILRCRERSDMKFNKVILRKGKSLGQIQELT